MKKSKKEVLLTIHGHFYQPPRENPWLNYIEEQSSAYPFHDWNERIANECYKPNSVARILDSNHRIVDIVNNYTYINFNFGPTLLSWLKEYSIEAYERIIEADKKSQELYSGHGNAIAQVYNHIIMPLASARDKITQVYWGIRDFEFRFGRKPDGMWLSESAVCDETLQILVEYGIKYTILSPFQADKVRDIDEDDWKDVSSGNIDPANPYRYYLKDKSGRYIDLFFYDGSISKSFAFEGVLYHADKLMEKIKGGIVDARGYPQLVNIATDGESYGHHTPHGDMALAYTLKEKLAKENIKLTNYSEYLSVSPPKVEVMIKEFTAWSCSHGVRRWQDDCGCSGGAQPGWNQQWRRPLRDALNWLNNELSRLYEKEAKKLFKDVWITRNNYIDVLLDNSDDSVSNFFKKYSIEELTDDKVVLALKLLEMQKNSMYMFTSCGWFFADISGIETVQILKYASMAIQLAYDTCGVDLEDEFLNILSNAWSNIREFGNGRDVYNKFVKSSIVSLKQVASHWAVSSLYEPFEDITNIYSYKIKRLDYERDKKGTTTLVVGRIEVTSEISSESSDMIFALLHFGADDFHTVVKGFVSIGEYKKLKETLFDKFNSESLTEVIRSLDSHFGKEYFTIKDLFCDEKVKIISELIKGKLDEFSSLYHKIYKDSQGYIMQLLDLGLQVPPEFKIAAEYSLTRQFNKEIVEAASLLNIDHFIDALDINKEAKRLGIQINKTASNNVFSDYITATMLQFSKTNNLEECKNIIKVLEVSVVLELSLDIAEAQNLYFQNIIPFLKEVISTLHDSDKYDVDKEFISEVLFLGEKLSFNLSRYYDSLSKNLKVVSVI